MKSSSHTHLGASIKGSFLGKPDTLQGLVQSCAVDVLGGQQLIRRNVIKDLEYSLLTVGSCEEHKSKIMILLRLMDLCTQGIHGEQMNQAREIYFYRAVTIGSRYLSERLWEDPLGAAIFSAYTRYIAPWIQPFHLSEPTFIQLAYTGIEQEAEKRRKLLLEEAADVKNYLDNITDYSDIICSLERVFGPIRLLIVSVESGEPLTIHRIDVDEIEDIRKSSREFEYDLVVNVFDKPREYRVIIDNGTRESMNQINQLMSLTSSILFYAVTLSKKKMHVSPLHQIIEQL